MRRIVVVGASIAGVHAVEALRAEGFDGELTLIGAEDLLPYDRPPLSKAALTEEVSKPDLLLRPADWYPAQGVDLRLGHAATRLDVPSRSLRLADGTVLGFEGLVLATGSAARVPTNIVGDVAAIQVLRTARDSERLRERLVRGTHLVVIGAGFIGLEVAASARSLGVEVTIVEVGPAPLAAVLGAEVGGWFARLHARHGVSIRCRESVRALEADGARYRVHLVGGAILMADTVVAGVGATPATEWLHSSGLALAAGGVVCDGWLRTAVPSVVAAGDIAHWRNELFDAHMRVEHWTTAVEQGRFAALSLLDAADQPYAAPPYFWTDQFTARTRTIGRVSGADRVCILRADDESLVALYGRGERLQGAVCVNAPRALVAWRQAVVAGIAWPDVLAVGRG
ncbi:MAG: NAD(P)/FAD-dependent oxidoreductase [Jatrophihabitantaceae bacterium]